MYVESISGYGYQEFIKAAETKNLPAHGAFQTAFTIKNKLKKIAVSETLLKTIQSSNPRPSGGHMDCIAE